MPFFPPNGLSTMDQPMVSDERQTEQHDGIKRDEQVRIRNRRRKYLDSHPDYFGPALELADPLLYDRLIRRFKTNDEREAEGRAKGYSGTLEADIRRSEAKLEALAHPDPNSITSYKRGPDGEILEEEKDEVPRDKEEGEARWRYEMEMRFIRGADQDFDYSSVDTNEAYDDITEEDRRREDIYYGEEEPSWITEDADGGEKELTGETGIQDF